MRRVSCKTSTVHDVKEERERGWDGVRVFERGKTVEVFFAESGWEEVCV